MLFPLSLLSREGQRVADRGRNYVSAVIIRGTGHARAADTMKPRNLGSAIPVNSVTAYRLLTIPKYH